MSLHRQCTCESQLLLLSINSNNKSGSATHLCMYTRLASFIHMYLCMLMHWKPKFSASALRLSSLYFDGEFVIKHALRSSLSIYMYICTVVNKYCIYFALFLFLLLHTSANSRMYTHTYTVSSHSVIRWLTATKQSGANTELNTYILCM